MKSISLRSTNAVSCFSFKSTIALSLQWIGAFVAFVLSMIAVNIISPLPQFIAGPAIMVVFDKEKK